jgi:hypothetical protein
MASAWYVSFSIGTALQCLLFWRAFRARLWSIYPFFYAYIVYTTLSSLAFALPLFAKYPRYAELYWWSYVVAGILRFGVAAEVYRYVFPVDSPLRSRVSVILLCAMLLLVFMFSTVMTPALGSSAFPDGMRKAALTVITLVVIILGTARFYGVGVGRNLWAMAIGLLIFMGSELMDLAAMDLAPQLRTVCGYVHPLAFNFTLIVWTVGLWRHSPNPPRRAPSASLAQELVGTFEHQWAQVSNVFRTLVKPRTSR